MRSYKTRFYRLKKHNRHNVELPGERLIRGVGWSDEELDWVVEEVNKRAHLELSDSELCRQLEKMVNIGSTLCC